jgi:hypothetical protein
MGAPWPAALPGVLTPSPGAAGAGAGLTEAWQRADGERGEIACRGGTGRTGTALACLSVLDGVPAEEAVTFARRHYRHRAVEIRWQRRSVLRFGTG